MQITEQDIARIPPGNVQVPTTEFVEVWRAAEQRDREQGKRQVLDWHAGAVALTCRWLAAAIVRSEQFGWYPAKAPVTKRSGQAYEELIEAELLAAEKLDMKSPRPDWLVQRPGWSEAICATLRWAWRCSGPPPLSLGQVAGAE